jgi:hypothetical protein
VRIAIAGREFVDSDRRLIETVCEAPLAPMTTAGKPAGLRGASS